MRVTDYLPKFIKKNHVEVLNLLKVSSLNPIKSFKKSNSTHLNQLTVLLFEAAEKISPASSFYLLN